MRLAANETGRCDGTATFLALVADWLQYRAGANTIVENRSLACKIASFGSGGGTRTPDPRIMIPVL